MQTLLRHAVAGIAVVAIAAGCGVRSQTSTMEGTLARSATCEDVITAYASRADVPSDYFEVAFIEAEGNSVYTTDNQLRQEIRKRAAEEGATGVIVNPVSESKVGVKVLGEALGTRSATARATALAIYLPADAERVTQRCGTR
jgi:predicted carbohydrate-binding protein with CBM5 and CBM33 domain